MFDNAVVIVILVLVGSALAWVLRKGRVEITFARIFSVWVFGALFVSLTVGKFGTFLGFMIMLVASALFLSHVFITIPARKKDAAFEEVLLKAKSGFLNEDEACELLKKATQYEAKGQLSEAKHLYELIVKSDTPISLDAQSCLNNPLLKEVESNN